MQSHNLTEDISTPKNMDFIIPWDYNSQLHKHYSERYSTEEVETVELKWKDTVPAATGSKAVCDMERNKSLLLSKQVLILQFSLTPNASWYKWKC